MSKNSLAYFILYIKKSSPIRSNDVRETEVHKYFFLGEEECSKQGVQVSVQSRYLPQWEKIVLPSIIEIWPGVVRRSSQKMVAYCGISFSLCCWQVWNSAVAVTRWFLESGSECYLSHA